MKVKLPIIDGMFAHCHTTSDRPSNLMEWDRDNIKDYDYVFLTDDSLKSVENVTNKRKYAWLLESPEITSNSYSWIMENHNKFDKIFTFKKDILDNVKNSKFLPIGGCWIDDIDRGVHFDSKNKITSMVASGKGQTSGHKLRHIVINSLRDKFDLYGRAYNPIVNKITSLKNYRFQIVIENNKSDYYFTEKLIDCLQTGTIPIYWGCPSICNFFDCNSIIRFDSLNELHKIINELTPELYQTKKESILKNFELSKKYTVAEHYLIENYRNEF
jgi:hypothetical protein